MFLFYIDDICNLNLWGEIVSLVDDTALLFEADTWIAAYKNDKTDISIVKKWVDINTLTLNIKKTKYIQLTYNINTYYRSTTR